MSVPRKRRVYYDDIPDTHWQDRRPVVAVHPGDAVRIRWPENPCHGSTAHVVRLNYYGNEPDKFWLLLNAPAAATGQLRVMPDQVEPILDAGNITAVLDEPAQPMLDSSHGDVPIHSRKQARDMGYTGDPCPQCGQLAMKRTGPCVTCQACSYNEGCG